MKKIIGIDLGTTHSTVSSFDESLKKGVVQLIEGEKMLPSVLYFPLKEEGDSVWVGHKALKRGLEIPDRMVSSAKSWLSHRGINRMEPILPLHHDEKISPVEATKTYLEVIKDSWNKDNPSLPFEKQSLFITVPASFDPAARELTLEAAKRAGYPETTLLEEPLAAFYAWLGCNEDWRETLKVGNTVLVVDCGGGTTDFCLIEVLEEEGNLELKKSAVGSHLLLGGDNIDCALAALIEQKLNKTLEEWQKSALVFACRKAKEKLLGEDAPEEVEVIIPGRGSKIVGGSIKAKLSLTEALPFLLEGFFPKVELNEKPHQRKSGLNQFGLPYAEDPRITAELAAFLSSTNKMPSHVLFNGGTLKAVQFRKRLIEQLELWAGKKVLELPKADLDFGVSLGAVFYGSSKAGNGIRVKGGVSRSFYIGIEESKPAIPGLKPPVSAFCVLPFGTEEGTKVDLPKKPFHLTVGEKASFRFFSCPKSSFDVKNGQMIKNWQGELDEIEPLEMTLDGLPDEKYVTVSLNSEITEFGALQITAQADDGRKWKLELNLRQKG